MSERSTTVLAISRQLGSGGSYIGRAVARRLGLTYLDREILQAAAKELGLAESDLEPREECAASPWDRLLGAFALAVPEASYVPPPIQVLYEDDIFRVESRIIREVAARSDAVVVGRAGFSVLATHPGLVSVAVRADRDTRIRRVMELYGIATESSAAEKVDSSDRQRAEFVKAFAGHDWNDARIFDLCLDTSRLGLDLAVDLVASVVAAKMRTQAERHPAPTS